MPDATVKFTTDRIAKADSTLSMIYDRFDHVLDESEDGLSENMNRIVQIYCAQLIADSIDSVELISNG
jgi:hypothetical protein